MSDHRRLIPLRHSSTLSIAVEWVSWWVMSASSCGARLPTRRAGLALRLDLRGEALALGEGTLHYQVIDEWEPPQESTS